jgi:hypothetical protein
MTNDLTLRGQTYALIYSDKTGSLRREVSRGATLPSELKIAHSDYIDSATKLPGKRSVARSDYYMELSTEGIAPVSAYIVVTRPNDSAVTSVELLAAIQTLIDLLQEDDSGLDLADEIFVNGQQ